MDLELSANEEAPADFRIGEAHLNDDMLDSCSCCALSKRERETRGEGAKMQSSYPSKKKIFLQVSSPKERIFENADCGRGERAPASEMSVISRL